MTPEEQNDQSERDFQKEKLVKMQAHLMQSRIHLLEAFYLSSFIDALNRAIAINMLTFENTEKKLKEIMGELK